MGGLPLLIAVLLLLAVRADYTGTEGLYPPQFNAFNDNAFSQDVVRNFTLLQRFNESAPVVDGYVWETVGSTMPINGGLACIQLIPAVYTVGPCRDVVVRVRTWTGGWDEPAQTGQVFFEDVHTISLNALGKESDWLGIDSLDVDASTWAHMRWVEDVEMRLLAEPELQWWQTVSIGISDFPTCRNASNPNLLAVANVLRVVNGYYDDATTLPANVGTHDAVLDEFTAIGGPSEHSFPVMAAGVIWFGDMMTFEERMGVAPGGARLKLQCQLDVVYQKFADHLVASFVGGIPHVKLEILETAQRLNKTWQANSTIDGSENLMMNFETFVTLPSNAGDFHTLQMFLQSRNQVFNCDLSLDAEKASPTPTPTPKKSRSVGLVVGIAAAAFFFGAFVVMLACYIRRPHKKQPNTDGLLN